MGIGIDYNKKELTNHPSVTDDVRSRFECHTRYVRNGMNTTAKSEKDINDVREAAAMVFLVLYKTWRKQFARVIEMDIIYWSRWGLTWKGNTRVFSKFCKHIWSTKKQMSMCSLGIVRSTLQSQRHWHRTICHSSRCMFACRVSQLRRKWRIWQRSRTMAAHSCSSSLLILRIFLAGRTTTHVFQTSRHNIRQCHRFNVKRAMLVELGKFINCFQFIVYYDGFNPQVLRSLYHYAEEVELTVDEILSAPCTLAQQTIRLNDSSIMKMPRSPFSISQNNSKDTKSCQGRISWSWSARYASVDGRRLCEVSSSFLLKWCCTRLVFPWQKIVIA